MASELKPCPFCGGTDVNLHHSAKTFMSWVSCKSCGLDAPSETGVTDEEAITYWNTRSQAEELLAAERAEKEQLRRKMNANDRRAITAESRLSQSEAELKETRADNAAKDARIKTETELRKDHQERNIELEAKLAAAEEALEPFAAVLEDYDPDWEDDDVTAVLVVGSVTHYGITLGDFRKARAVLGEEP